MDRKTPMEIDGNKQTDNLSLKINAEVSYTCPSVSMLFFVFHLRLSVRISFVRLCNIPTDLSTVYLSAIKLRCLSVLLSAACLYSVSSLTFFISVCILVCIDLYVCTQMHSRTHTHTHIRARVSTHT